MLQLDHELEALTSESEPDLPPYPAVALRVQEAMNKPDCGLADVAQLVGADAALAAAVLRCANSPIYRRGAPATSLTSAIIRIGVQEVMRLLLASCLACHAHAEGPLVPLRRMVWLEGLAGAALCQELARLRGLKKEEAFLAGLLHDFGKIIALAYIEKRIEKREDSWPEEAWSALVERHHVALGSALASHWQLPRVLADVISSHHGTSGESPEKSGLVDVVKMSDQIVGFLTRGPAISGDDLTNVPGLGKFVEREAVLRVAQKIPEFVNAFEPSAPIPSVPTPRIEQAKTTLASNARPARFGVTVSQGRQDHQYTAKSIATNGLAVVGKDPLPRGRLHETTIHSRPGPLHIWSLSRMSRQENGSYHLELHPFALSGVEHSLWSQLASGAATNSPGSR